MTKLHVTGPGLAPVVGSADPKDYRWALRHKAEFEKRRKVLGPKP